MKRRRRRARPILAHVLTLICVTPRICALSTASTRSRVDRSVSSTSEDVNGMSTLVVSQREDEMAAEAAQDLTIELPPWLQRLETYTEEDAMIHLDWLEYALLEEDFDFEDIKEILQAVKSSSRGNVSVIGGIVDFCRLVLQMREPLDDQFVTKDVLLASALHFGDCITARETGVYEMVRRAIHGQTSRRHLPFSYEPMDEQVDETSSTTISLDDITPTLISAFPTVDPLDSSQQYPEHVLRISRGAARVKRVEILAHTILEAGRTPSREESSRLRGLLLSVMDDWRALAIRAVACLYRLEGILHDCEHGGGGDHVDLTQEVVKATREALHVYAPLAQRLGMQRLKARLQDCAFRIMYKRQYQAVSSLFRENEEEMHTISSNLASHMEQVLRQNPSLMDQLENLKVTSRVKEPYSLWKKLLTMRARRLAPSSSSSSLVGTTESSSTSSELSLFDVKDGIAVRVILTARKSPPDEPEETTRARERLLCYYVQQILRNYWPAVDGSRIKDYIQYPKPNGYQSLHYTASIENEGRTWPFEVQVRSDEMHRIAEYGVAAHWDYKLGSRKIELLSPSFEDEEEPDLSEDSSEDIISVQASEESYIDALVTAREDLVQQKVFVFFAGSSAIDNSGQLLSLPVGARVRDAISELSGQLDTEFEIQDGSVLRNGRVAKSDDYVGNGDVLLITL